MIGWQLSFQDLFGRRKKTKQITPAEFRVVTNGHEFKVQIKRGDSTWSDCARLMSNGRRMHYFDTEVDAQQFKLLCETEDLRRTQQWTPVYGTVEPMVLVPKHYAQNVLYAATVLEDSKHLIDRREGEVLRQFGNLMEGGVS